MKIHKSLAINIDKFLGKATNKLYRIGIELEGGWETPPKGYEIVRDGSVVIQQDMSSSHARPWFTGELQSGPIEVEKFPAPIKKFPAWMLAYYPPHVNETCGLHVHMSFREAFRYARLMQPEFPATVLDYVERWARNEGLAENHPIWDRLMGKKDHCQPLYWADLQAKVGSKDYDKMRKGHRYTVINYAYGRYKTVECRLLPMMESPEQGIRAVQELINITNAFLVATAKREEKVEIQVRDTGEAFVEHRREYV